MGLVTPIAISRRCLHLKISSQLPIASILSVVYNRQSVEAQKSLWKELSCISALNFPWFILGNFNAIYSELEHLGGNFKYYSRKTSFSMISLPKLLFLMLTTVSQTLLGTMVDLVQLTAGLGLAGALLIVLVPFF